MSSVKIQFLIPCIILASCILYLVSIPTFAQAAMVVNSSGVSNRITNGLVGWWTFDGGDMTSTVAFDKSGNANNGTIVSAIKSIGKIGQGLLLDGVNDRVTVSDSPFDFGSGNLTLAAWVYPNTNVEGAIISKDGISATNAYYKLVAASGQFSFSIYHSPGCTSGVVSISPTYPLKKWYHVVGVRDGGGSTKLYVNGQLVDQDTGSDCGSLDSTYPLELGVIRNSTVSWLAGKIDDARVYNRALSANEVYSLYQYGNAKINVATQAVANQGGNNGLVGHWTFNGGDCGATYCVDKSGNNLTGTFTNGVTKAAGKIGQATRYYSSLGTYTSVASNAKLDLTNTGTLALWVKPTTSSEAIAGLISKHSTAQGGVCTVTDGMAYSLEWNTNNGIRLIVCDGIANDIVSYAYAMNTNWTHIAGVWDGSNLYIYLNGKQVATNPGTRDADTNTNTLRIGGDLFGTSAGTSDDFDGLIDDARIYNRALSANEIYSLYMYGK